MPEKDNINKALSNIANPSVFNRIVREIDPTHIPTEYIERITVFFNDGDSIDLTGDEIDMPIPLNKAGKWDQMDDSYTKIREVKVFIDTVKLERDINKQVDKLFRKYL